MHIRQPQPRKRLFRLARSIQLVTALTCVGAILQAPINAAAADSPAARAQTGTVEGRVFNAANGTYLTNARVTVEGTSIQAYTNDAGEYQLRGVPAGTARIKVNYTGQRDLMESVTVNPAEVATTNFTFNSTQSNTDAKTIQLDQFVVQSERFRNAQQLAINEERSAVNIKSVVALDSLGYVSDGNVGSFVRFLPGVDVAMNDLAGVRGNPDNVASVGVRGFGPENTLIMVDGVPLASSNMDNVSRTATLDAVSINNASRLEIIKVATPDMPQNAPGGAINLITRGAFELSRAIYDLTVAFNATSNALELKKSPGPYEPSYKIQPNIRFSASIPINKKVGVSFSVASDNKYSITNYSRWRDMFFTGRANTSSGVSAPVVNAKGGVRIDNPLISRYELNDFEWLEHRMSGNVRVDWRPIPGLEIRANGQLSTMDSLAINHRSQWQYNGTNTGVADWGPTFVRGVQRTATYNPQNAVTMTIDARDRVGFTTQGYIDARYRKGPWSIDARATASESYNAAPDRENGHFSNADLTITPGRMDLTNIDSKGRVGAILLWDTNGNPLDYSDISTWNPILTSTSGFRARSSESENRDLVKTYKLDVGREFNLFNIPISLKAGGLQEEKKNHKWGQGVIYEMRYIGPALPNAPLQTEYAGDVFGGYAKPQHWVDMAKIYDVYKAHPEYFSDTLISATGNVNSPAVNYQSRVNNTKGVKITSTDYYYMGTARLFKNRLTVIAGARQSRQDTKGYNVYNDPTAPYLKNADGTLYRDSEYPAGVRFDGGANGTKPRDAILTDTALRARMQAAGVPFIPTALALAPDGIANGGQSNNLLMAMRFRTIREINSSLTQPTVPQVQLAYDITDNIKLQLAWSEETRLPNLDSGILVGGASFQINEAVNPTSAPGGDGVINISNVKGLPEMNTSYNAKLAWYPRNGSGRYSISYYYKDVKKSWQTFQAFSTDSNYEELLASMNLDAADYPNYRIDTVLPNGIPQIRKGFEIEAVQNLGLLGQWGRGFDAFVTYTRRPVTQTIRPNVLGFVELTPVRAKWTGGLSYSAKRFSVQTRLTYTEAGITYSGAATSVTMPDGSTPNRNIQLYELNEVPPDLNIQVNYNLTKRVRLFAMGDHVLSGRTFRRISDEQTGMMPEYASWREMTNSGVRVAAGAEISLEGISQLWKKK